MERVNAAHEDVSDSRNPASDALVHVDPRFHRPDHPVVSPARGLATRVRLHDEWKADERRREDMMEMFNERNATEIDRRTVIGTIAAGLLPLAGCSVLRSSSSSDSQSPAQPADSSPINSISYETDHSRTDWTIDLAVELGESTDVTRLNLVTPDGSLFGQTGVPSGTTKATLTIAGATAMESIEPGEHTLVALNGSDTIGEHTFSFAPAVSIGEIVSGSEGDDLSELGLAVTLENTGNAPVFLSKLVWENGPQTVRQSWDTSPYDGEAVRRFVDPDGETTIVLEEFRDPGFDCSDGFTEEATVSADLSPGDNPSRTVAFEYGMVDNEQCLVELESGSNSP